MNFERNIYLVISIIHHWWFRIPLGMRWYLHHPCWLYGLWTSTFDYVMLRACNTSTPTYVENICWNPPLWMEFCSVLICFESSWWPYASFYLFIWNHTVHGKKNATSVAWLTRSCNFAGSYMLFKWMYIRNLLFTSR